MALYMVLYAFIFERWENIFKIPLYIYCIYKIYTYICREH